MGETTLAEVAGDLRQHPTPWILAAWLAAAVAVRATLGAPTWREPVVVAVLVGLQPFSEWVIHVTVLHFRPRPVAGRTLDLHVAREHRRHHEDPADPRLTLIPVPELAGVIVAVSILARVLVVDDRDAATVVITVAALMSVYEWTHFLQPTKCSSWEGSTSTVQPPSSTAPYASAATRRPPRSSSTGRAWPDQRFD